MFKSQFSALINAITTTGIKPGLSTYEKGLVELTNRSAFALFLATIFIFWPLSIVKGFALPILVGSSIFYPITILFNHYGKYTLARHYLIGLFEVIILLVSVYRGRGSGILFTSIPTILLMIIFFYEKKDVYVHLLIMTGLLSFIFIFSYEIGPLQPYSLRTMVYTYPIQLLISLLLTAFIINFFYFINQANQRELAELNNTKSKLLSVIGHDLRAPLNSLKGILDLFNNNYISQEEFSKYAKSLQKNVEVVSDVLENLLLWSVAQTKELKPNPSFLQINRVINKQIELLAETAKQKGIVLENKVEEPATVYADEQQVGLILRNLLSNAIKFTPEGGTVTVTGNEKDNFIELGVKDTGVGIGAEDLQKLFKLDGALSKVGTKGEVGTGLGLLLCKEMVEKNNGIISVVSEPGKGTLFSVSLPVYG